MSDREDSPDWLQCFQAPKRSFLDLSSSSSDSEDGIKREPAVESSQLSKDDQTHDTVFIDSGDESPATTPPKSKSAKARVKTENTIGVGEDSPVAKPSPNARGKSGTKKRKGTQEEPPKEEVLGKPVEAHVSSRLPLMMSEKIQRSKALVECKGESIDMSGDVGAVGRVVITDASSDSEMLLDLKGTIYKTKIVPSRTFCVVSFNQTEAKAVMNDFIQLQPVSNVYEAETMIEGTLEGFAFDSDEEADKIPKPNAPQGDQNNEGDELNNGKANGKTKKASLRGQQEERPNLLLSHPRRYNEKHKVPRKPRIQKSE